MGDIDMVRVIEYGFNCRLLGKMPDIVRALQTKRLVAVKSCHASGKTFTAARIGLAHVVSYEDGIGITTAPSNEQVEKVMWSEVHTAIENSRFSLPKPLQTELRLSARNYLRGFSTDRGVRFQGYHGRIVVIIDEAAGVADEIHEAVEGIRAGGEVSVLMLGNPAFIGGRFYDVFRPGSVWTTFTISAFDTPNFWNAPEKRPFTLDEILAMDEDQLNDNPTPQLIQRWYVKEKYLDWGPESPLWAWKVMGEFPDQSEDSLIALRWIYAANQKVLFTGGRLSAGVDVAGPGEDETVLTICERTMEGVKVLGQWGWVDEDPRGKVAAKLAEWGQKDDYEMVHIDSVGIGWNFATHFKDLGYTVHFANVAETAREDDKYSRRKAEWYWNLRLLFQASKIWGVVNDKTQGQLAAMKYKHDTRGRIQIESKEEMRKRGVKGSPDWAESLMLAAIPLLHVPSAIEMVRRPSDVLDTLVVPGPADWRW